MFWIIVCALAALFIYLVAVKPYTYWSKRGVAQYSFLKMWKSLYAGLRGARSIADAMKYLYNSSPGHRYFGAYQFYKPVLLLRDPELIKQITVKDFDHFMDHASFIPENSEPLWEKNLVALKGEKWRDMRSTLSPSFTGSKMKMMFGLMSECAKQFVQYFEEQDQEVITLEMKDVFTRYTNDVIASTAFGLNCDSLRKRENDFYEMGKKITNFVGSVGAMLRLFFVMAAPRLATMLDVRVFDKKIMQYFKKVIRDNIAEREKNGIVRPDMINLLMESRKERIENSSDQTKKQRDHLSDEDIAAQAMIFFFAGFDSVATLLCFMAYELAVNPDSHQTLQAEVDNMLNDCDGEITYEALSTLKYMDMVISETLRKWPVAVVMDRVCVKPYTIPPVNNKEPTVTLNKGDMIWIPVFGIHWDPEYYPEPERFDPERFSDENKTTLNLHAYMPFGSGPRNCIGNRFALMETKLVFCHLMAKFNFTVVKKTPIPIKLSAKQFQLVPEGGFWLGLEKRNMKA